MLVNIAKAHAAPANLNKQDVSTEQVVTAQPTETLQVEAERPVEVQPTQAEPPRVEPPRVEPKVVTPAPKPEVKPVTGSKQDWMTQAGIPSSEWSAVDYIVTKESGWRPHATNKSSGAYGLCQSLPASKMATAGADYRTNPVTQLKWCTQYAKSRYGGWIAAMAAWKRQNWW